MDDIGLLRRHRSWMAEPPTTTREAARAALLARFDGSASLAHARKPGFRRTSRVRRVAVAGGVLTILAAAIGAVRPFGGSQTTALAATPPIVVPLTPGEPAQQLLTNLAEQAARQPVPQGRFDYLLMSSWYLHTAVAGGRAESEVVPSVMEKWTDADGSAVSFEVQGEPIQPDAPAGQEAETSLGSLPSIRGERAEFTGSGSHLIYDQTLPLEPAALRETLLANNNLGKPDDIELLTDFTDRLGLGQLEPDLLAAYYRMFADEPTMRYFGTVTDRAGRSGEAVGLDTDAGGLPTRHALIIDPDTGEVLAYEQILTTDAGALNVPIPSVISYELFHAAGKVDSLDERVAVDRSE